MQTKQIPENKELLKKTDYKAKITDIGNKLSRISGLATTVALNAVESNTPNFSNLVKKKQIMTQKYRTLNLNILLQLIMKKFDLIQNLIHLIQR